MKLGIALSGFFLLGAAQSADRASRDAPGFRDSRDHSRATLTGCVDEQDGRYVLLNSQMQKIARLKSFGPDDGVFAKHLGHMVRVSGARSAANAGVFTVVGIVPLAGSCGDTR